MALDPLGEKLKAQDWTEIHRRLMRFALGRVADEAHAEDVVQEAIASAFARRSTWDPKRVPDLAEFLMGVVRNAIKSERRAVIWADEKDADAPPPEVADDRAWTEDRVAANEIHARRLTRLRARLEAREDADALRVLELFTDGVDTPSDLKTETGWTADRVAKARLRLQRAALDVARADDAH